MTSEPAGSGDAEQAAVRIVRADNPGPLTLDGTRSYVIGRSEAVILDPGPSIPEHLDAIERALDGAAATAVCLTHSHRDHTQSATELAERLGVPVRAWAETLRRIGANGRPIEDGEDLPIDGGETVLRALHTPGHASDHISYLWLPSRTLFTGDLVLGRGTSVVTYPDGAVGPYLASLARLIALRPERILPGHGDPVDEPLELLREYRAHRLVRGSQIHDAVTSGGARSVPEIREAVYGPLPPGLDRAAELSILAHLEHLHETGHDLPPGTESGHDS